MINVTSHDQNGFSGSAMTAHWIPSIFARRLDFLAKAALGFE